MFKMHIKISLFSNTFNCVSLAAHNAHNQCLVFFIFGSMLSVFYVYQFKLPFWTIATGNHNSSWSDLCIPQRRKHKCSSCSFAFQLAKKFRFRGRWMLVYRFRREWNAKQKNELQFCDLMTRADGRVNVLTITIAVHSGIVSNAITTTTVKKEKIETRMHFALVIIGAGSRAVCVGEWDANAISWYLQWDNMDGNDALNCVHFFFALSLRDEVIVCFQSIAIRFCCFLNNSEHKIENQKLKKSYYI